MIDQSTLDRWADEIRHRGALQFGLGADCGLSCAEALALIDQAGRAEAAEAVCRAVPREMLQSHDVVFPPWEVARRTFPLLIERFKAWLALVEPLPADRPGEKGEGL